MHVIQLYSSLLFVSCACLCSKSCIKSVVSRHFGFQVVSDGKLYFVTGFLGEIYVIGYLGKSVIQMTKFLYVKVLK